MRTILTILCLVLLSSCSQESEVVTGTFLIRDGVTFDQNTNTRVTGIIEDYHENGQLSIRSNYIDGKRNGLIEEFYENGQLSNRSNYIDGKLNGLYEEFHENGQLSTRSNYTDGERDDLYESYDENGNVITRASRLRALAQ